MAKFQPGIVARSMNQSTSDINGLQIGSSTHSLMSTMNTQRPIDPRLRRYWQPVSTQNLHHETLCQPKQTRITDNSLEHRISIADYYKRYALDPSEQGKDSKVRKNQQTLARSIPKDGQNAIAVYDVPIDRSNTPDKDQEIEQNQVTSQNDRGKENEPELSFYPNFETPTRTQETKAATDSPISNEYEEMVNVAEDEITIKDEVAVMPTDAIQVIGEFDFDDSDDTEIYDFEIFNEERKIDISAVLKGPAIIDMAEGIYLKFSFFQRSSPFNYTFISTVNLSPNNEVDLEEKKEELQSFKIKTELEEVEDSDNQNDLDDLLVPVSTQFDFNQTVRIILDRIDQSQPMENLDFLQKKKEPLKPLLESELEAEPEPEPKPEPEPEPDLKLTVQKADQLLSDIEITTSDDDIIYVLSSDYDSDVEMQNQ